MDKQLEQYEENTRDEFSRSLERDNEDDRRHLHSQGSGRKLKNRRRSTSRSSRRTQNDDAGLGVPSGEAESSGQSFSTAHGEPQDYFTDVKQDLVVKSPTDIHMESMDAIHHQNPVTAPFMGGEVFFFDYGVAVFWNMTEEQEEWILNDISQFGVKRLAREDIQTEEFHFEYAGYAASPRIYNDM